tara:strand:- start:13767 stop:13994 length:228 start_codon:yes stop_codon:yes gene_type:complete
MKANKSKLKEPVNTEENRERLVDILLNDMSTQDMREVVRKQLLSKFKVSKSIFLSEYWKYYEETYGHCPFGLNEE